MNVTIQRLRELFVKGLSLTFVLFALTAASVAVFSYTRGGEQAHVRAAVSSNLNFQGRLLNAAGNTVPDGLYNLEFKLYDVQSGGTELWTETRTDANKVRVVNGYFSVNLGDVTAFPNTINWDQDLWLGMNVGGTATPVWDGEMSPRMKLTAVPYAFQAKQAEALNRFDGTYTGTLDFLALTANRAITLPDQDGTLCIQGSEDCVDVATTGTTSTTASNSGLEISADGLRLLGGCSDAQMLRWNATAVEWQCTSAGGSSITVRATDNSVTTTAGAIEFGPAIDSDDEFIVTDEGAGVTRIRLGNTVLTTANYAATLDGQYVNVGESPATGDISGSFSLGLSINPDSVALGTDTTGDYIQALGTLTGLSVTGNSGEGSTPGLSVLYGATPATAVEGNTQITISAGTGLTGGNTITLGAGGTASLSVAYGSTAGTAVQGNTTLVCPIGTGNLNGGGNTITLGAGGTCSAIATNDAVTFATSVTTPLVTNAGTLTVSTTGANDLTLSSGSGEINIGATSLVTTSGLTLDLSNASDTVLAVTNSGTGTASLNIAEGVLQTAGTTRLTNAGVLQNVTNADAGTFFTGGTLTVARGGTGAGSFTTNGVIYGNGTGALQTTAAGTAGQVLIANGSGVPTFTSLSGDVTVDGTGVVSIGANSVALGTDTTGDYIQAFGTLTGLQTTGNTGEGSTPTLSVIYGSGVNTSVEGDTEITVTAGTGLSGGNTIVLGAGGTATLNVVYGSTAGTAVQGNTQLTCAAGTGDLSGGGNTITLGAGGSCNNITISEAPVFDTSVTTPLLTTAGALTIQTTATAGADDIVFQTAGTEVLRLLENGNLFFERGTNDATIVVATPSGAPATYTFSGATGTVLTSANFSTTLDGIYVNEGQSLASGDISGSFQAGLTINADSVALGADTVGNYVASITAGGGLTGDIATEGGLATLAIGAGNGIQVNADSIAVIYGSTANTAVQGNTQITCASGTGNLSGGGTVITLGAGGTCAAINTNNDVTFSTAVRTPLLTNAGPLTVSTTGANDLTLSSGSGLVNLSATELATTGSLNLDLVNASTSTLSLENSGAGIANLDLVDGNLIVGGQTVITSARALQNLTGLTVASGGATITGNLSVDGTVFDPTGDLVLDDQLALGSATTGLRITTDGVITDLDDAVVSFGQGLSVTGNTSISGTLSGLTGLTVVSGGASISGGLTLNTSALSGVTTLNLTGAITGATATNTINGLIINAGALSGVTGLVFTSGNLNLANGGIINAGSIAGATTITASGNINTTGGALQTNSVTRLTNAGALQNISTISASGNIATTSGGLTVTGNSTIAGTLSSITTLTAQTVNATSLFQHNGVDGRTLNCAATEGIEDVEIRGGILITSACRGFGLSDQNLKQNIVSVSNNILNDIRDVDVVNFNFDCTKEIFTQNGGNYSCDGAALQTGVIAQELALIFPELVFQGPDGYNRVNYEGLSMYTLKAVQELAQQIDASGNATVNSLTIGNNEILTSTGAIQNLTGLSVISGGASITGNSTISGTLSGLTGLTVNSGGASITGNTSISGTLSGLTGLTVASGGATIAGGATLTSGALNLSSGGITNAGSVAGATTLSLSGAITGATATNTINGLIINAGALSGITGLTQNSGAFSYNVAAGNFSINSAAFDVTTAGAVSGVTTLGLSGAINGATTTNTINGLIINAGALSGITGYSQTTGALAFSGAGNFSIDSSAFDVTTAGAVSGVTTLNLSGAITGATVGNTINGLVINAGSLSAITGFNQTSGNFSYNNATGQFSINSSAFDVSTAGAVSGVTTLGLSGAITGATTTNTINGLVINSGSLSAITGYAQASGNFAITGTGTFSTGTGAVSLNGATSVTGANTFSVGTGTATFGGRINANAGATVATGQTLTVNGDAISDLTGNGLEVASGALQIDVTTTGTTAATSANSGLESTAAGLRLLGGCTNGQLLKWNGTNWACAADNTGISDGSLKTNITNVGSVLGQIANVRVVTYNFDCLNPSLLFLRLDCASHTGIISQEIEAIFPGSTVVNSQGYREVNFQALQFYTMRAVVELANMISANGNASLGNISTGGTLRLSSAGALSNITGLSVTSGGATIAGGLTVTGATSINNNALTAATNIGTGTTTGAISIGGGLNALTINSTAFDVSAAGAVSGVTTLNTSGLITGTGGLAISGGAVNLNSGGLLTNTNINTGVSTGTVTIGGGLSTLVIDSTAFDVSAAGALSGITSISASGNIAGANFTAGGLAGVNAGTCAGNNYLGGIRVTGGIITAAGACNGVGLSDQRLKQNVVSLEADILDQIKNVRTVSFDYKCDDPAFQTMNEQCEAGRQTGVIAQELAQIFPDLVYQDEFGYNRVKYDALSIYNLRAVSELAKTVNSSGEVAATKLDVTGDVSIDGVLEVGTIRVQNVEGLNYQGQIDEIELRLDTIEDRLAAVESNQNLNLDLDNITLGNVTATGSTSLQNLTVNLGLVAKGAMIVEGQATFKEAVRFEKNLLLEGEINVLGYTNVQAMTVNLDLIVKGAMIVEGQATFKEAVRFEKDVVFEKDVAVKGQTTFNNDTAGIVTVEQGQTTAQVTFVSPKQRKPIIALTLGDGKFAQYSYRNVTETGFEVVLATPATEDLNFSWVAIQTEEIPETPEP